MNKPLTYILDADGEPVPCDDVAIWGWWMECSSKDRSWIIAQDKDEGDPASPVTISTVFLGLDHSVTGGPPVLWETMVFGGALNKETRRYTSRQDAIRGHQEMCQRVSASKP